MHTLKSLQARIRKLEEEKRILVANLLGLTQKWRDANRGTTEDRESSPEFEQQGTIAARTQCADELKHLLAQ